VIDSFWISIGSAALASLAAVAMVAKYLEASRRVAALPLVRSLSALRVDVDALREEKRQIVADVEVARSMLSQKTSAEQWLELHLPTYEKAVRELPGLTADIALSRERQQLLIADCLERTTQLNKLESQIRTLEDSMGPAREELTRLEEARDWYEANRPEYQQLAAKLPDLQAQVSGLEDQRTEIRKELAALEVKRSGLLAEHDDLRTTMDRLEVSLNGWQEEELKLRNEVAALQAQQARLASEVEKASVQSDGATAALNEVLSELENSRSELKQVNEEVAAQEVERASLHAKREDLRATSERLNNWIKDWQAEELKWRDEVAALHAQHSGLLSEVELSRVERDAVAEDLTQVRSELETCRRELKRKTDDMVELESQRVIKLEAAQFLDRLVKKLEADKKQIEDELERSKARLQKELDQINDLIAAAVKRWGDVGPTVGADDRNRLAELWQPVLRKTDFKTEFKPSHDGGEQDALKRTSQHLQNIGLRFGKRVLNAFHTSLKVAEMSPLVVLAGISGTGKSELPRRYAEGMGMHALTLAVQPRWDSPQDMFGFYNYLESRYRATELARALVQMDRFAKERKEDWNYPDEWLKDSLSDRMLLVLLDEMNLARVEYYFSEFLSKLETRRGIQRNVPSERRKAEVMLEVGLQSLRTEDGKVSVTQQPTLPLFVDRNVLFVGTMNEDESTQTLSDKVVDRANVLRFGKPQKLGAEASASNGKPTDSYLPYATWEKWIADEDKLKSSVRDQFNRWVHDLNQAMQNIGRPFAHRTYGAMLSYIANYPEPDQYKLAMADQIELKLLPKFRGLDPSDSKVRGALGTVQKLVEQMDDTKLLQALRDASKQSEHQFVWHGVDRTDES